MINNNLKVSIVTITYGHEDYILETIKGVFMQEYDGEIEFIIVNDNSPDNTDQVIKEFLKSTFVPHNIEIKYTCHSFNKGMMLNFSWALNQANGKYIALCEGDDYWTDPLKIQRQVEFLEENSDISLLAENGIVKFIDSDNNDRLFNNDCEAQYYNAEQLLDFRKFPTASVMFRSSYLDGLKKMKVIGDTIIWVYLSTKGKVYYNGIVSSVYNRGMQGVVLSTNRFIWANEMRIWNIQMKEILKNEKHFDFSIFKRRNFSEFYSAYNQSDSLIIRAKSLIYCFKYEKFQTIFFLKKDFINFLKRNK